LLLHLSAEVQITCEIAAVPCESKGAWLFKQLQILLMMIAGYLFWPYSVGPSELDLNMQDCTT
jgi:hypothetical protein